MKKHLFAALLLLSLLLMPLVPVTALEPSSDAESYSDPGTGLWELEYGEVYTKIKDALLRGETQISLSSYRITPEELSTIFQTLYYTEAELFVMAPSYSYSMLMDGRHVSKLMPTYRYDVDEIEGVLADFHDRIDKILSEMPKGLSPLGRLIFLYDYLATHFVYEATDANYDAYGMLVEGNGVCQAYSLLLRYLLRAVGIPAECVTSSSLVHEWNIVKLGDAWYHVDVTWDDTDDRGMLGQVDHNYFLLSDAAFMAGKHYASDWVSPVSADDLRYDGAFQSVSSRFVFDADGQIYVVKDTYLCAFDETDGFMPLKRISATRPVGNGQIWSGLFSGLALLSGRLLYNTESEVRLYDPSTGEDSLLLDFGDVTGVRNYLYGFLLDGASGTVTVSFKTGAGVGDVAYTVVTRRVAFTVVWMILGAEYEEIYFLGETPLCKEETEVTDDRYRFTFLGWDRPIAAVTEDAVYTAEYSVSELFTESAAELLLCLATASDEGESLYARYTALTRALAIKDGVNPAYEGVQDAVAGLEALISAYNADAEAFSSVFAAWVPLP